VVAIQRDDAERTLSTAEALDDVARLSEFLFWESDLTTRILCPPTVIYVFSSFR
jgi:hypothetical protein